MSVAITIPEAGESIAEVQIGDWKKAEGDHVDRDEVVVEIETDKASMELPAPVSGTLERIIHGPGDIVPVGQAIAFVREQDGQEPASPERAAEPSNSPHMPPASPTAGGEPGGSGKLRTGEELGVSDDHRSAPGEIPQEDAGVRPAPRRSSSAEDDQVTRQEDMPKRHEHSSNGGPKKDSGDRRERKRPDNQQELESQARVLPRTPAPLHANSVEADPSRRGGAPAPAASPRTRGFGTHRESERPSRRERLVPLPMIRRRIAQRLVEAQQTMAMLTTFNEVDMGEVARLRREHGPTFQERHGVKLGMMSFFVAAVVQALRRIPQLNAELRDDHLALRDYCDIGVAVSTDYGLVVPVIRNADQLSLAEIEDAIADVSRRARERRLAVDEMQGGTFTITNGGVFGSLLSTPIINPPQCGILGLHAIQERPVARGGEIVIRPMMYVALTYDHRIVDGKEAVTFLRSVRESIEAPARLILDV